MKRKRQLIEKESTFLLKKKKKNHFKKKIKKNIKKWSMEKYIPALFKEYIVKAIFFL